MGYEKVGRSGRGSPAARQMAKTPFWGRPRSIGKMEEMGRGSDDSGVKALKVARNADQGDSVRVVVDADAGRPDAELVRAAIAKAPTILVLALAVAGNEVAIHEDSRLPVALVRVGLARADNDVVAACSNAGDEQDDGGRQQHPRQNQGSQHWCHMPARARAPELARAK